MVIVACLRRWRWALLTTGIVILLAVASFYGTLPLRDSDKANATRHLVAWIVKARPVPGFGEVYPDSQWMPNTKRFFVICDLIPPEVSLIDDPRVQRITVQEYDAVFKKHRFDDTDYMFINLKSESETGLVLEFSNVLGLMAGHGYRFEFYRTVWGLRASGNLLWVS